MSFVPFASTLSRSCSASHTMSFVPIAFTLVRSSEERHNYGKSKDLQLCVNSRARSISPRPH
eukprot:14671884-Heterocapsa_arctica.AAC.1